MTRSNTFAGWKANDDQTEAMISPPRQSTNSTSKFDTEVSGQPEPPEQEHPWTEAEVKVALGIDPDDPTVSVRFERIDSPTPPPTDDLDRLVAELDKGLEAMHDLESADEIDAVLAEVGEELREAMGKFDNFQSAHEGYAVILEELDELWDEVKANGGYRKSARKEAIQVAAMAIRYVLNVARS